MLMKWGEFTRVCFASTEVLQNVSFHCAYSRLRQLRAGRANHSGQTPEVLAQALFCDAFSLLSPCPA